MGVFNNQQSISLEEMEEMQQSELEVVTEVADAE